DCRTCEESPTPDTSTLSLHDALPISAAAKLTVLDGLADGALRADERLEARALVVGRALQPDLNPDLLPALAAGPVEKARLVGREIGRHTSELQSRENLVCRLLLEKKK